MSNGDYSRRTFDPTRNYSGVLMQQGRIQLDADWNELVEMVDRRFRIQMADTVGQCAVPRHTTPGGFKITEIAPGQFKIGLGRIYVDGLLAENHGAGEADKTGRVSVPGQNGSIRGTPYSEQRYLHNPPHLPAQPPFLVYLDVWQREVSYLEEPDLIEKAVGVDTTVRLQTVWQVLAHPVDSGTTRQSLEQQEFWRKLKQSSAGQLSTRVPENGDYRGADNRLYRVEVHGVDEKTGQFTFKWSRDNASTALAVKRIENKNKLIVQRLGAGGVSSFKAGDWVEVIDDWREFEFPRKSGEMHRIESVDEAEGEIILATDLKAELKPTGEGENTCEKRRTRIRRWDQRGKAKTAQGEVDLDKPDSPGVIPMKADGDWIMLDPDGIQVRFTLDPSLEAGAFHVGDYWLFTARTVDRTVEGLTNAPPLGIHHHFGCLAFVSTNESAEDWREGWPQPAAKGNLPAFIQFVTADSHNDGHFTIQSAIDSIKESGGTVCLGPGRYKLDHPLKVERARSIRLTGQGWNTRLEPDASLVAGILINESSGVRLEELNVTPPSSAGSRVALLLANSSDLTVQHCSFCLPSEYERNQAAPPKVTQWETAIAVSGRLSRVMLRENFLVADQCIGLLPRQLTVKEREQVGQQMVGALSGRLRVANNVLIARPASKRFQGIKQRITAWWWRRRHCRKS